MAYKYPYDEEIKEYKPARLNDKRSTLLFYTLTLLTLGVYALFFFTPFSFDLDKVAPKRDGTKTINFLFVFIVAYMTASIAMFVWDYHIAGRIEEALIQRGINYQFGTKDFWAYQIIGSFIIVGPFIFRYRLIHAMNLLCADYNKEHGI